MKINQKMKKISLIVFFATLISLSIGILYAILNLSVKHEDKLKYREKAVPTITIETINRPYLDKMVLVSQLIPELFMDTNETKALKVEHKFTLNLSHSLPENKRDFKIERKTEFGTENHNKILDCQLHEAKQYSVKFDASLKPTQLFNYTVFTKEGLKLGSDQEFSLFTTYTLLDKDGKQIPDAKPMLIVDKISQ